MTENIEETSDARYVFVKLTNGENIMCTTFSDIKNIEGLKYLEVIDPIQIFSFKIPHNGNIIEKYIMQTWTPFSNATTSFIPVQNVIFIGDLKEFFIEKYIEYITDPNGQQLLQEGGAEEMSDDDEQDEQDIIEEIVEEVLTQTQDAKKWYH